jgi:aminomethyltransferase
MAKLLSTAQAFSFGRTGYTGEDGFEIFVPAAKAEWLWNLLLERGQAKGIEPCGLGARDTLRLEAGLPLYGHELERDITPIESGLGWSVKPDKGDFIGRDVLAKQKAGGLERQIVCLKGTGKAAPRQGYSVFDGDKEVGKVTSGAPGRFCRLSLGLCSGAYGFNQIGTELSIGIRDTKCQLRW